MPLPYTKEKRFSVRFLGIATLAAFATMPFWSRAADGHGALAGVAVLFVFIAACISIYYLKREQ